MIEFFKRFPGNTSEGRLPHPPRFSRVIGPGIILLATALGSGEVYFWPGIAMKYGFVLIWPAILAIYIQYILNTEFARYTITTGETVITGFIRLWKPLGYVFLLGAILPWIWPGWAMGGAYAISWIFGVEPYVIAISFLLIIGVLLTFSRKAYVTLEKVEFLLVAIVFILVVIVFILVVKWDSIQALNQELIAFSPKIPQGLPFSTLLAALAFCGAGGTLNLATSNWVQEKRFGMAALIKRNKNRFTGQEYAEQKQGYHFLPNDQHKNHWRKWWKIVRKEQFLTFFTMGLLGIIMLMLIAHSLLFGRDLPFGMEFLKEEGIALAGQLSTVKPWLFYIIVAIVFFTTAFGVIDHVARISADIIHTYQSKAKKERAILREDNLYLITLWFFIGFGLFVLLILNIDKPPQLLSIAGSRSGILMFMYAVLILILNLYLGYQYKKSNATFNPFKLSWWRLLMIILGILLYGGFSVSLFL